jgi:sugar lactone lactonase YvrE
MFARPRIASILFAAGCSTSPHPLVADVVAHFQPALGQLPEGLAVRDGTTYAGFAPASTVVAIDGGGSATTYATVPTTFGGSKGYTLGLVFDPAGNLYVAQASFDPSVVPGIYRIPAGGGSATAPWASAPTMTFPNGFSFAADGSLFVADSTGAVFKIDAAGNVATWKTDPVLVGDPTACPDLLSISIGANGIVATATDVWVTNTDHGALVRIPIEADGTAGAATAVVEDCSLAGADGLALDGDGSFVVALNVQDKLARVGQDGHVEVIASGGPLDFPASVVLDGDAIYATAAAFVTAQTPGDSPAPALVDLH